MLFLVLESDEFGGVVINGGYQNEELTDSQGPIETYLSVMTQLVQVVSILCDVGGGGGGVNISLFLGMLVFLMLMMDE